MKSDQSSPTVVYQAAIVATHEVHQQLASLQLDVLGKREPRPDGSWIERVALRSEHIEPIVAKGAIVVLERMFDPRFPSAWIVTREAALASLEKCASRIQGRGREEEEKEET